MTTRNADLLQAAEAVLENGNGHCGESTSDVIARQRTADRFASLASPRRIRDLVNSEAALVEALRELKKLAHGALNAWTVDYAPDQCAEDEVEALDADRVAAGGTLMLICAMHEEIDEVARAALARATDPAEGAGG